MACSNIVGLRVSIVSLAGLPVMFDDDELNVTTCVLHTVRTTAGTAVLKKNCTEWPAKHIFDYAGPRSITILVPAQM